MEDILRSPLSHRLEDNQKQLSQLLGKSTDLIIKELQLDPCTQIAVIYIDGLVDTQVLHNSILFPFRKAVPRSCCGILMPDRSLSFCRNVS